jgi:putative phosphoribosyl transferase
MQPSVWSSVGFRDRVEAGQRLADRLERFRGEDVVVYALPRGGVILGVIIARRLSAPLDLVIARKIGHPWAPEYAIGAVTEDGPVVGNETELAKVNERWLEEEIAAERAEARRRREAYLAGHERPSAEGRTAIVVDDGVATGLTLLAAIKDIQRRRPRRVIVAVPVIPREVAHVIRGEVDELIAVEIPVVYLGAVGAYYHDFPSLEDHEVIQLMNVVRDQPHGIREQVQGRA